MAYVRQCSGCGEGQDCCSDDAKWGYWTDDVYSDQAPFDLLTSSEWVFQPNLQYATLAEVCSRFGESGSYTWSPTWGTVTDLNYDYENCWYSDSAGTIIFKKSTDQEDIDSGAVAMRNSSGFGFYDTDTTWCVRLNADLANDDMGDVQLITPRDSDENFKIKLKTSDPSDNFIANNFDHYGWIISGDLVQVGDRAIGGKPLCPTVCNSATGIGSVTITFKSNQNNTNIKDVDDSYVLTQDGCAYYNNNLRISYNESNEMWIASGNSPDGYSISGSATTPNGMPNISVLAGIAGDWIDVSFS